MTLSSKLKTTWFGKQPLSYECQYKNGKKHGIEKVYKKDDCVVEETYYLFDEEVSQEEYRKFELIEQLSGVKV